MRFALSQPVVNYVLKIDTADLSSMYVEMNIRNAPDTFEVAMVAHPEYDDRYWRFVKDMHVEGRNGEGKILREDSALWRIITRGGDAVIHYRIELPGKNKYPSAWKPFITSKGALTGGTHSFMYIVGATLAPSHIKLELPKQWQIATGLEPTSDPTIYYAPSVDVLVDAPILAGTLKTWSFTVEGIPHKVVYYSDNDTPVFDTAMLVTDIKKIVEEASVLFHGLPYREYFFLLRDSAYGALEHNNSVTLGAPASELRDDLRGMLAEIAHEYFHAWNIMRIHPAEYGDVSYKTPALSRGLWWSEGLTMLYADLFLRRAGLPVYDSSRIMHLQNLMAEYFDNPGNQLNPEKVSMSAYAPPGILGDYIASTHLQGELIGTMLDFIIRDATNGKRSIDDVMRKMFERFGGEKGFTGNDIEQIVSQTCGCDAHAFFDNYISGDKLFDFNNYLRLLGLRSTVSWKDAMDDDGKPEADLHVYAYLPRNEKMLSIGMMNPANCWGKAGLHTGDKLVSINATALNSAGDFYDLLHNIHIGDTLSVAVQKPTGLWKTKVIITGYKQAVVRIEEIKDATAKQQELRKEWMNVKP